MNKNKLIFAIIWGVLTLALIVTILVVTKTWDNTSKANTKQNLSIWILSDSKTSFWSVVSDFKTLKEEYKNTNIIVESFTNIQDYNFALQAAIISGSAPDIFMLNNNEAFGRFENQTALLNPEYFNVNDFRQKYKQIFWNDLIVSISSNTEEKTVEALKGIPVGYETLGIYYNRTKGIKSTDLDTITSMNNAISRVTKTRTDIIPLGIWNGSTVYGAADILTQFFLSQWSTSSVSTIDGGGIKKWFASYLFYGDSSGDNAYDTRFVEMLKFDESNLDLFSKWEIAMVIWYPSMIQQIANKGFKKSLLLVKPFPTNIADGSKTLANYNYFVLNKDAKNQDLAQQFLWYLWSDNGASNYLENFPYYLPALLSLESDRWDEKISDDFNIILNNFYNPESQLTSFDKGISEIYDREIIKILDNPTNFSESFWNLQAKITCIWKKIQTLWDLSTSCE